MSATETNIIVCMWCGGKGWYWGWTCDRFGRSVPAQVLCRCQR